MTLLAEELLGVVIAYAAGVSSGFLMGTIRGYNKAVKELVAYFREK